MSFFGDGLTDTQRITRTINETKRTINKHEREIQKMEAKERYLLQEAKKQFKLGNTKEGERTVQRIATLRQTAQRERDVCTRMENVSHKMATTNTSNQLMKSVDNLGRMLERTNRSMEMPHIKKVTTNLTKQTNNLALKDAILNNVADDIFGDSLDSDDSTELISVIMDEINLETDNEMTKAKVPTNKIRTKQQGVGNKQ